MHTPLRSQNGKRHMVAGGGSVMATVQEQSAGFQMHFHRSKEIPMMRVSDAHERRLVLPHHRVQFAEQD